MKVGKKELYLLLALLGIGIAICAWQFGFNKINAETAVLRADTELLQADIQKYSAIKDNIDLYQKGIEDASNKIAAVLRDFPVAVLEEDMIMLGREFEKDNADTYVSGVSFTETSNVFAAVSHPVEETTVPISYNLFRNQVGVGYNTSYDGFKNMVEHIYDHKNRMSINSYTLAYDEGTGLLTGSVLVDMYYVTGTDKQYTQQNLSGVSIGTDNIFGTLE